MAEGEMQIDEARQPTPFQLQFDNPIASPVKIAEWNPEKDLLAMATEESKIVLHRFNWQRLWSASAAKSITAICWRPDGRVIAVGMEDGSVSLHDVENGKILKSVKLHEAAVICLNWEEEVKETADDSEHIFSYVDRTSRFFPSAPRIPRISGIASGDPGLSDDHEEPNQELCSASHHGFNVLCSGDMYGNICLSIFGIFPAGKINVRESVVGKFSQDKTFTYRLPNASIHKISLSRTLNHLSLLCSGELVDNAEATRHGAYSLQGHGYGGLHYLHLSTSIFSNRKKELHQIALQASNILELTEVVQASLDVMHKHWSDAMHTFREKFRPLSSMIADQGLDSSSQEELLVVICGARTNPTIHQFLTHSLGEMGLKRVAKAIDTAGKEMHLVIHDHLQPAVEIIGFRVGELRGFSRFRSRFQAIGLDTNLIDLCQEKTGMLLVHIERLTMILALTLYQFQNFFCWLSRCIKLLTSESEQVPQANSELVIMFLRSLFNQDPLEMHLKLLAERPSFEIDRATSDRLEELVMFGGFPDSKFLRRTLVEEFEQFLQSYREVFSVPLVVISEKLHLDGLKSLYHIDPTSGPLSSYSLSSISHYKGSNLSTFKCGKSYTQYVDYVGFILPDEVLSGGGSCVGIARGLSCGSNFDNGRSCEALLLNIQGGYSCVDLALYQDCQIVLLLNETLPSGGDPENSYMMVLETNDLPFASISISSFGDSLWNLCRSEDYVMDVTFNDCRVRSIPYSLVAPLAVSASRGVACVFSRRRRALVYILDENEEDIISDD